MNKQPKEGGQTPRTANRLLRAEITALFGRRRHSRPPVSLPRIVSHYELHERIGEGAKGTVYLARDRRLDRWVAIKVLRRRFCSGGDSRARFFREARCASALNHPNVVTVHELGYDRGMDFIVMEYVPGKTLNHATSNRRLCLQVCLDYALQIARAVAAVHAHGIAHRDLKPSNFVIGTYGTVKLLDFGLAKVIRLQPPRPCVKKNPQAPETLEGTIMGTVGYMSPEQVRGYRADQRSDIFSLGAIFYEMLTGRRAFHENSPIDTMSAILYKKPPHLPARIPAPISRIVWRCLEKKPSRRYKSATELVAALTLAAAKSTFA